jgi:hypothetical protein
MVWAVTVLGQKLRCHGEGSRRAVVLRGRYLLDVSPDLLAEGLAPGQEVSPALLVDRGVRLLPARPVYDPEPELRRLWQQGVEAAAEELGHYRLVYHRDTPAALFPGEVVLAAAGPTGFWAELRLATPGVADQDIPVTGLLQVGVAAKTVLRLQRRGIHTLGSLAEALAMPGLDLPLSERTWLRRALAGVEVLPLRPWTPPLVVERRRVVVPGVGERERLLALLEAMAREASRELMAWGAAVGSVRLRLYGEGHEVLLERRFAPPAGEARLVAALAATVSERRFPAPVEELSLTCRGESGGAEAGLFRLRRPSWRGERVAVAAERRELRLALYDPLRGAFAARGKEGFPCPVS